MPSISTIILVPSQVLFGLWPLMFLAIPEAVIRHGKRYHRTVPRALHNLFMIWGFLLALRLLLLVNKQQPTTLLIPEPQGTIVFLVVGLVAGFSLGILSWRERRIIRGFLNRATQAADLQSLSPTEFEVLVAEVYRSFGHRVECPATSKVKGVDLIIYSPTNEKWIVQCQLGNGQIDISAVRDFFSLMHIENAHRGTLISSGVFSPQAMEWAEGKSIYLYDGEGFMKILKRARANKRTPKTVSGTPSSIQDQNAWIVAPSPSVQPPIRRGRPTSPLCPNCHVPMVERAASTGAQQEEIFYSCPNFPACEIVLSLR